MTAQATVLTKAQRELNKQARQLAAFPVTEWRTNVEACAADVVNASKRMLDLMLSARGKVEFDTAKEAVSHAFATAYAAASGMSFEDALKAKSVRNRVSDALAVFKAVELPALMPANLQHAAAECRKVNPGKPRAPRTPSGSTAGDEPGLGLSDDGENSETNNESSTPKAKQSATELLAAALEALRNECGDNSDALEIVADMSDLLNSLSEALNEA